MKPPGKQWNYRLMQIMSNPKPNSRSWHSTRINKRQSCHHRIIGFSAALVGINACETDALAAECWQVVGWSNPAMYGAQAIVEIADCTTIPDNYVWAQIDLDYGQPPDDDLYLRVHLDDGRVTNWTFDSLLIFAGYDIDGKPEIITDGLACGGCANNNVELSIFPPEQGVPTAGSRVRLRHHDTNRCMYTNNSNGAVVSSDSCYTDPAMTFMLDSAGGGKFRIRDEPYNQCLYASGGNGGTMNHWGCWQDPAMAFALDPGLYGYRLRSPSWQCAYNYYSSSYHWGCWASPDLDYYVDVIEYGGWTSWSDQDNPTGSGDWELLSANPGVCAYPQDIECRTKSGVDWTLTNEVVTCDPSIGFYCRNSDQPDAYCQDYEVRFLCP